MDDKSSSSVQGNGRLERMVSLEMNFNHRSTDAVEENLKLIALNVVALDKYVKILNRLHTAVKTKALSKDPVRNANSHTTSKVRQDEEIKTITSAIRGSTDDKQSKVRDTITGIQTESKAMLEESNKIISNVTAFAHSQSKANIMTRAIDIHVCAMGYIEICNPLIGLLEKSRTGILSPESIKNINDIPTHNRKIERDMGSMISQLHVLRRMV